MPYGLLALQFRPHSRSLHKLDVAYRTIVIAGIFRYQLLSDQKKLSAAVLAIRIVVVRNQEILLGDRSIQLTLFGWLTTAIVG